MPGAAPIPSYADYNTGYSSGVNSGTTQTPGSAYLSGSGPTTVGGNVGGAANISVAALVAGSLLILLLTHLLGFRFGFDVSVGRRG